MNARGMGRVYPRGRIWWVQYCFRGKVHWESSRSTKRSEAVALLRRRQAEMGLGRLVGPATERTTFSELEKLLLAHYRINERKSLARAVSSLNALRAFFGDYRAADITFDRITQYVANRLDSVKPATVRNELAALHLMLKLGARAGKAIVPEFPTLEVRNTRSGFFERGELDAVCVKLPANLRPVAQFAYVTGWRIGEIRSLQWRHVDFRSGEVRLEPETTKNGDGRVFPFGVLPELKALLRQQQECAKELGLIVPWVFHRDGKPLGSFRKAWMSACRAAGLPGRLFHDLRRSAVRNLERAGISRSVAMKLTGHKTESIFRRYAIVSQSDLAEGVKKLASVHQLDRAGEGTR